MKRFLRLVLIIAAPVFLVAGCRGTSFLSSRTGTPLIPVSSTVIFTAIESVQTTCPTPHNPAANTICPDSEPVRETATATAVMTATAVVPATATATVTRSPAPTRLPTTAIPEPEGCLQPPEDYTRVSVNGFALNQRTVFMLEHAQELYGGEIDLIGNALTQGSYHDNGAASFGTHLGGGAVDLSVMRAGTYQVLTEDIEPLIQALRTAGFAAWLREYGELFPDSPIHIHAVAIGDRELSQPARDQLDGPYGYFLGFTGVPQENGIPVRDRHGGPVICAWMRAVGAVP